MAEPEVYMQRIRDMGFEDGLKIRAENIDEAKQSIKECRMYQKDLRQTKKLINLDMKEIRARYRDEIAGAGEGRKAVFSLLGSKGLGTSMRAEAKREKRNERDSILEPYNTLKALIDGLVTDIDRAKIQLQTFIDEERAEEESLKYAEPVTDIYCSNCNAKLDKNDKFCRECGQVLQP